METITPQLWLLLIIFVVLMGILIEIIHNLYRDRYEIISYIINKPEYGVSESLSPLMILILIYIPRTKNWKLYIKQHYMRTYIDDWECYVFIYHDTLILRVKVPDEIMFNDSLDEAHKCGEVFSMFMDSKKLAIIDSVKKQRRHIIADISSSIRH